MMDGLVELELKINRLMDEYEKASGFTLSAAKFTPKKIDTVSWHPHSLIEPISFTGRITAPNIVFEATKRIE